MVSCRAVARFGRLVFRVNAPAIGAATFTPGSAAFAAGKIYLFTHRESLLTGTSKNIIYC
jgi:hypothetical protein